MNTTFKQINTPYFDADFDWGWEDITDEAEALFDWNSKGERVIKLMMLKSYSLS